MKHCPKCNEKGAVCIVLPVDKLGYEVQCTNCGRVYDMDWKVVRQYEPYVVYVSKNDIYNLTDLPYPKHDKKA